MTRLDALEQGLSSADSADASGTRSRIRRLKGFLTWKLETDYHERLTAAHDHLRELNIHVEKLTKQYEAFVRRRQAASHSYVGYENQIDGLRGRVGTALERVERLRKRQGHELETVATRVLAHRRDRLAAYQNKARFAFADSYDRAAKTRTR